HPVAVLERVARQERLQLDIAEAVDEVAARCAREQVLEKSLGRGRLTKALGRRLGKERGPSRRVEVGDPRDVCVLEAAARGQRELAGTAKTMPPLRGLGQQARTRGGRCADRRRNPPVPGRGREPAKARIAREQLVRAVTGE